MSSTAYLDYVGSSLQNLSDEDKQRFGELWHGFEQVFASVYQKFVEDNLNTAIQDILPFATERWLPYDFSSSNAVQEPAVFVSTQDLTQGVNLSLRYMLKISTDANTPFEVDLRGVVPGQTTLTEILTKLNIAAGFTVATGAFENSVVQLRSQTTGVNSKITFYPTTDPTKNASEFILGLLPDDLPLTVPQFPFVFTLSYDRLSSVPELRDAIRDESLKVLLFEGTDYALQQSGKRIAFKAVPLPRLWATRSLFDQESPWNNFGFLMDIYQKNSDRYVDALRGLWFAFWTGPRPVNVLRALYLLFGLPTAKEPGTVTIVTPTSITTRGDNGTVRSFGIPEGLTAIVAVGDRVGTFDPLVSGITVLDKLNSPGFIEREVGRAGIQSFLTESATRGSGDTDETKALKMLEEYTFLPQVQVETFVNKDINLGNVKTFLDAIKPLNKAYLFQIIVGSFRDPLALLDKDSNHPDIDVTQTFDSNQTTFSEQSVLDAYETVDNSDLNLDIDGILFEESLNVEVRSFGVLIDSFDA